MTAEGAVKKDEDEKPATKPEVAEKPVTAPASEGDATNVKKERVIKPLTPGCARPVMIHRAIAGSIERFTAILVVSLLDVENLNIACQP